MQNFLQKHTKLLSVGLSVVCSVFLVAVVVSAATTIGASITTAGDITTSAGSLTLDTGNIAVTAGNLTVGGTASVTGLTNLKKATSTMLSAYSFYAGGTATTTIDSAGSLTVNGTAAFAGSATSTFTGANVRISKSSGTSTAWIGAVPTAGRGGCIALSSGDGTSMLYVFVTHNGGALNLVTSTDARDCGFKL